MKKRKLKKFKMLRKLWRLQMDGYVYWKYIDFRCWIDQCWPRVKLLHIWYGVGNLIRWRKVIWQDRDWDAWTYLLPMMEKKIEQMEDCERRFSIHKCKDRLTRQMQTCRILIQRLRNDNYLDLTWYELIRRNWRGTDIMHKRLKNPIGAHKHEDYQREQDLDLLFKIMRKHIREWWN
jgi:hypothetical protein